MTRVDFYVLGSETPAEAVERTACRIAEKAFRHGHRVYLHVSDDGAAERLDELLWTFRAGSFVPHARWRGEGAPEEPVLIGRIEPPPGPDVLVNLAPAVPPFFSRFARVAEIVGGGAECRAAARERFRWYRERGYPLHTHEL